MRKTSLILSVAMLMWLNVSLAYAMEGEEPTLPPPVFKTAPEDGETIEAITPYNLRIEWYVLDEDERVHIQISRDAAFTMLICNETIEGIYSFDDPPTFYAIEISEDGAYYVRIRREIRRNSTYSGWATRSFIFKQLNQYFLTVHTSPEDSGTIVTNPIMNEGGYAEGTEVNITASAKTGFTFSRWMPSGERSNILRIIMDRNREITAEFKYINKHLTITSISPTGGGELIINPAMPDEGYPHGTEVSITAVPNQDYEFEYFDIYYSYIDFAEQQTFWTSTINTTMNCDQQVKVYFYKLPPNRFLTTHIIPEDAGKIIADPVMSEEGYSNGTDVVLTAIPNQGYEFIRWDPSEESSTILNIEMSGDKTVSAVFKRTNDTIEGEVTPEGEEVHNDDNGACGGCGGSKGLNVGLGDWLLIGLSLLLLACMQKLQT